jgi:CTP synthase (UTP-ammonia lyase)
MATSSPTLVVLGDRDERFLTHREIDATLALLGAPIEAAWVSTDAPHARDLAAGAGAIWLVSGGPYRDDDTVLAAIDGALDRGTPFLGTCSGFQYACLALARRLGVDAAHAEFDPAAADPLIARLACPLYGVDRRVEPVAGTRLAAICGGDPFPGHHHCGYGLAAGHEALIERAGAVISARAADAGAEAIELPGHPFFIATAFQPQVGVGESGVLPALLVELLRSAGLDAAAPAAAGPAR